MNAICERLIGTLRRELLDRTLILSHAHLRAVLAEYQEHYNTARPIRASASASRTLAPFPASPQLTSARVRSAENRSSAA
jgi:transposase InsO family protein